MRHFGSAVITSLLVCLLLLALGPARLLGAEPPSQLQALERTVPNSAAEFTPARVDTLLRQIESLHQWFLTQAEQPPAESPEVALNRVQQLTGTKHRVDQLFHRTVQLRSTFAKLQPQQQQEHARQFLRATSAMIDLSGRMRYALHDVIDSAAYVLEHNDDTLAALLNTLHQQQSSIGASVMIYLLDEPTDPTVVPIPLPLKLKLLEIITSTRQADLLPQLATLTLSGRGEPELIVAVAECIRSLGLPQDIRPGQDPDLPPPFLTAEQLHRRLLRLNASELSAASQQRLESLLAWSKQRAELGVVGDSFRVAGFNLQPGDWLLMRNPSPYNHFTTLAPGLFTHVGVVATETGADGLRRFVIVEMPEQSATIPATNVDAYLLRTLHYFFLRHSNLNAAREMASAAASMIGNESQFDLQFRTHRVLELAGQPLADRPIHTYCAGFLLLCALQTEHPRENFFPLAEHAPNENCQKNLAKLGMAIGDEFISPTGALFSPNMELVAYRRPMYEPTRAVKEGVYDHFAARMIHGTLVPSPSAYQALREKLAGISKQSPWLARALARANNVSERLDLESAAKAAAVVETLDETANHAMNHFIAARTAMLVGPLEALPQRGYTEQQIENIRSYRQRHAAVWQAWIEGELTPRELREALVAYYVQQGQDRLDARFFGATEQ